MACFQCSGLSYGDRKSTLKQVIQVIYVLCDTLLNIKHFLTKQETGEGKFDKGLVNNMRDQSARSFVSTWLLCNINLN